MARNEGKGKAEKIGGRRGATVAGACWRSASPSRSWRRPSSATSPIARRPICPGVKLPDQGNAHIQLATEPHVPYNSDPPTSGPHLPYIAPWGIHTEPIVRGAAGPQPGGRRRDGAVPLRPPCPDLVAKLTEIVRRYEHAGDPGALSGDEARASRSPPGRGSTPSTTSTRRASCASSARIAGSTITRGRMMRMTRPSRRHVAALARPWRLVVALGGCSRPVVSPIAPPPYRDEVGRGLRRDLARARPGARRRERAAARGGQGLRRASRPTTSSRPIGVYADCGADRRRCGSRARRMVLVHAVRAARTARGYPDVQVNTKMRTHAYRRGGSGKLKTDPRVSSASPPGAGRRTCSTRFAGS